MPAEPARLFTGGQSEPTGKMPGAAKRVNVRHGPEERGRGDHADPGNLEQTLGDRIRRGHSRELSIEVLHPLFEHLDSFVDESQGVSHVLGQSGVSVLEEQRHLRQHRTGAKSDRNPVFSQHASQRVEPRRPGLLPLRADPMKRLQRLLLGCFHRHGLNAFRSPGYRASPFRPIRFCLTEGCEDETQRALGCRAAPRREAPTDFRRTLALTKRWAPAMRSLSASVRTRDSRTSTHG